MSASKRESRILAGGFEALLEFCFKRPAGNSEAERAAESLWIALNREIEKGRSRNYELKGSRPTSRSTELGGAGNSGTGNSGAGNSEGGNSASKSSEESEDALAAAPQQYQQHQHTHSPVELAWARLRFCGEVWAVYVESAVPLSNAHLLWQNFCAQNAINPIALPAELSRPLEERLWRERDGADRAGLVQHDFFDEAYLWCREGLRGYAAIARAIRRVQARSLVMARPSISDWSPTTTARWFRALVTESASSRGESAGSAKKRGKRVERLILYHKLDGATLDTLSREDLSELGLSEQEIRAFFAALQRARALFL